MNTLVYEGLAQAARRCEPVALGIISGVKGSSPQKLGAKALFYADGRITGTLGGGCLEAEVQKRAVQALATNRAELFQLVLDDDFGWDDGLICGGEVRGLILPKAPDAGAAFWSDLAQRNCRISWGVDAGFVIRRFEGEPATPQLFQEIVSPPCALWIAGAGHIARAVAPLAVHVDFSVTVFDDRPALANRQFFPGTIALRADTWDRLLSEPLPEVPTFALIVTRGHRHDALVLREWIHKPFVFLGMIGSRRKAQMIFEHFIAENIATPQQLEQVASPVGIKIRSQTVPEIAISILAQYIDKRGELQTRT
jgi:xanthine dehydrogenase accessory factor